MIDRWRRQARQEGLETSPTVRERGLERENRELKEKLAGLYLENEHLKKLGHWLLQHKSASTSVITVNDLWRLLRFDPMVDLPSFDAPDGFGFFHALDRFQRQAFGALRRTYRASGNDSFCKLVAVKVANALAAEYHFRKRHAVLVCRPVQLQVDPTNGCHLSCPSCLHSANPAWSSMFDWPSATLRVEEFSEFCDEFGPFAVGIALFRDGEPLLHHRFPEFVVLAKSYLLQTLISTNLSVRLDVDALVASGLDRLVAAIDGASPASYSRYRRGGNFDLVIDNLRAIVRARRAQSTNKPWLVWQFLAFEHNAHEIEVAHALARDIGVDQLIIARPNSVTHDDPSIHVASSAPFGETLFAQPFNWCGARDRAAVVRNAERIDEVFRESWVTRFATLSAHEPKTQLSDSTCDWLYYNLTMDAARRITPCCLPPMREPNPRHLVFATFDGKNGGEVINSPDALRARSACRSGSGAEGLCTPQPYCLTCTDNPTAPIAPNLACYLAAVDEQHALPDHVYRELTASSLIGSAR